uniref:Uncharacterized protein n=1 Tax=Aegilops tauschii TaxID=37682 RepID=M8AZ55_AEGTA
MDPAHNILYVLCLAQGALFVYRIALFLSRERIVKKVSRAYGFQDDGHAVSCYLDEIRKGYSKKISSAREPNLITYAIELMESKSPRSCLSGALILDRLLTRKHPDEIKAPDSTNQHRPSALSELTGTPLVEEDTKNKKQRKKRREEIRGKRDEWRKKRQQNLFSLCEARGRRRAASMEAAPTESANRGGDHRGAAQDDKAADRIMAPVSYDLVHRAGHSEWSTEVVERSFAVMLRLIVTAKRETATGLLQQMSEHKEAIITMERIVSCEKCKGRELQMKAMQILAQLCMEETPDRGNLIKILVSIFVNVDSSNSIRQTTVKSLVVLFPGRKSVAPLLPKEENDGLVCGLTKILVGDNDTCRRSAAEILEHLCIHYAENGECVGTQECHDGCDAKAHDKLDLDLDAISLGDGRDQAREPGECVMISLAMKTVQLNRDLLTGDSLTAMKLTTRMVIAAMKKLKSHGNAAKQTVLESLLDSLSRVSETMLDLEGCMVFATRMSKTMPDISDTLDSFMKQARQLHGKIKGQDSEIVPAS